MKYTHRKFTYLTGSVGGYKDDTISPPSSKKYFYIKVRKDPQVWYIGKFDGSFKIVDASKATDFSQEQAIRIREKLRNSPKAKNWQVEIFETSKRLNNYEKVVPIYSDPIHIPQTDNNHEIVGTLEPSISKESIKKVTLEQFGLTVQDLKLYREQCDRRDKRRAELREKSKYNKKVAMIALAVVGIIIGIVLAICISFAYFFVPIIIIAVPIFILFQNYDDISPRVQVQIYELDSLVDKTLETKIKKYNAAVEQYNKAVEEEKNKEKTNDPSRNGEETGEVRVRKYKRQFKTGDTFQGRSFVDMLNKALGTNYETYRKCSVPLTSIGGTDKGIAWVVYMNNTTHGTRPSYLWRNKLSLDGNTIKEKYCGNDKNFGKFYLKSSERLRLAFQRDPEDCENEYKCKFVGLFLFSEYDEEEKIRVYKKIADTYTLG